MTSIPKNKQMVGITIHMYQSGGSGRTRAQQNFIIFMIFREDFLNASQNKVNTSADRASTTNLQMPHGKPYICMPH